jgi:acetaldehyde dehydrogenase (acetylating)
LKFGGTGHTAVIHATNDARIREYGLRMPAMRVLVNTPSPQGSTGITTNVFPAMTLGCGAVAGNATSDNIGPQHLFNIKRLAYAVRKPEETFEMPLDINAAPTGASGAAPTGRTAIVSAVERYLAARGFASAAPAAPAIANVATEVVDRFLAKKENAKGAAESAGGYG